MMTAYVRPEMITDKWCAVLHDGHNELWRSELSADRVEVMSEAFSRAMGYMPEKLVLEDFQPAADTAA